MELILIILYAWAGYWAYGVVFYEGKIVFHEPGKLFATKLANGLFLGWLWIPVALLKRLFVGRR